MYAWDELTVVDVKARCSDSCCHRTYQETGEVSAVCYIDLHVAYTELVKPTDDGIYPCSL